MKNQTKRILLAGYILVGQITLSAAVNPDNTADTKQKYDWDNYPVPVKTEGNVKWELQSQSDDFNYEAPAENKSKEFFSKWTDFYHNHWTGPAPTFWCKDHVWVSEGLLRIKATRPEDAPKKRVVSAGFDKELPVTYTGCITSTKRVKYPVFVEARVKIAKSVMASDVWMLSPDDTQEIDILEAYGSDRSENGPGYFPKCLHLSHHVFIRNPFKDYQPTGPQTWYQKNGTIWNEDFHNIGVYWKSPFHLEYYVDGELVRTVNTKDIIDPHNYTNGTGLEKELDIIINMEDQSWRAARGLTPTDEELKNEEHNTFLVDWIRVYKPIK